MYTNKIPKETYQISIGAERQRVQHNKMSRPRNNFVTCNFQRHTFYTQNIIVLPKKKKKPPQSVLICDVFVGYSSE